jgi:anthranilate synthase/aminodeoxychorismate synthase-like glutamine amidotransferase
MSPDSVAHNLCSATPYCTDPLVLIDNYDSFTFNLVEQLRRLIPSTTELLIIRNDQATAEEIIALRPIGIVISPGPGDEKNGGVCLKVLRLAASSQTPVLGICLGHQLMVHHCGGRIIRAIRPVHGHAEKLLFKSKSVFADLDTDIWIGRYHSLIACHKSIPAELEVLAWTQEGEVMAVEHRSLPWVGMQFHPESFLTTHGDNMIFSFLNQYLFPEKSTFSTAA